MADIKKIVDHLLSEESILNRRQRELILMGIYVLPKNRAYHHVVRRVEPTVGDKHVVVVPGAFLTGVNLIHGKTSDKSMKAIKDFIERFYQLMKWKEEDSPVIVLNTKSLSGLIGGLSVFYQEATPLFNIDLIPAFEVS